MSGNGPEFPEFATAYTKAAREARSKLPPEIQVALIEVEGQLAEDPQAYLHRTVTLTEDMFIYKHPQPHIELTCKIDHARQVIHVLHVVSPALRVVKPVFVSYSHKDAAWLEKLRKWLHPLEKRDLIQIWDDREIQAGDTWRDQISGSLAEARAALLLVTQDFLVSDFISNEELPLLLDAAKTKGVKILWVAVSASTVDDSPLAEFQAVNSDPSMPLDMLDPAAQNLELQQIYKRIKQVVGE